MNSENKARVIVIDDELPTRIWLKSLLKSLDCEVVGEAENGRDGFELFKNEKPDLVLLDLMMPVMKGTEALDLILQEDPDAFVILLTSVRNTLTIYEQMELGAKFFLAKDTPPTKLKAALAKQLEIIKSS